MDAFQIWVEDAFTACRTADVIGLAFSALAATPLLADYQTQTTVSERGWAVYALVAWAIDQLRPPGEPKEHDPRWRAYLVLWHYFLQGASTQTLVERLALSERRVQVIRQEALTNVAKLLKAEAEQPVATKQRRAYTLAQKFQRCTKVEQQLLHIAQLFRSPFPGYWLTQVRASFAATCAHRTLPATAPEIDQETNPVYQLITVGFLVQTPSPTEGSLVCLCQDVRTYLESLPPAAETMQWHQAIAALFQQVNQPVEAVWHLRQAGAYAQAAHLLLQMPEQTPEQRPLCYQLLNQFRAHEVDEATWVQIKVCCGNLAENLENVESALRHYRQALIVKDHLLKARVLWYCGRAFDAKNPNEALLYYNQSIELLLGKSNAVDLLIRARICRAWLYLQGRQDFTLAATDLKQAEHELTSYGRQRDVRLSVELANAWGEWHARQQQRQSACQYHLQAWVAANELQETTLMFNAAYNLAWDYAEVGNYQQALGYYQECQYLARQQEDKRQEALTWKGQGACYYWLRRYAEAVACYQQAYQLVCVIKDDHLRATLYCDLAEAHAELGDRLAFTQYIAKGLRLAENQNMEALLPVLTELQARFSALLIPPAILNERQRQAVAYLQEYGAITNSTYRTAYNVSAKQAERDLQELVKQNVILQLGKGRSVHYALPKMLCDTAVTK